MNKYVNKLILIEGIQKFMNICKTLDVNNMLCVKLQDF